MNGPAAILFLTTTLLLSPYARADTLGHRGHEAHVHGDAELSLAQEGGEILLLLDSPAVNILGFEHAPSRAREQQAFDRAIDILERGDELFRFNGQAECRQNAARVETPLLHHTRRNRPDSHADISVQYRFRCAQPRELRQLKTRLFTVFPGMSRLRVQYIAENGQGAALLTATEATLPLRP